jgi:hypothetical protein
VVDVVAAQRRVAAGGQHLEHAGLEPQQREIEGSATEVVDDALLAVATTASSIAAADSRRHQGAPPPSRLASTFSLRTPAPRSLRLG